MTKINLLRKLAILFIAFFLLTPTIKIPGFIGIRLDDLLAFSILGLFIFLSKISIIKVKFPIRACLLLVFFFLLLISITWGSTYSLPTSILDLTKYIWLIKLLVIYLVFYNYIFYDNELFEIIKRRNIILSAVVVIATISALISISQFFNPLNINKLYVPIVAPTQYTTLMQGYGTPRVVGMIGNPNAQGYLLALSLLTGLFLMLTKSSKKLGLMSLVIFIAMLMTLSRSALIVLLVGAFTLFLLYKKDKIFALYKIFILILVCLFLAGLIIFLKDNEAIYNLIIWRFEALTNIMEDKSFLARFHGWTINLEFFYKSPLIGVGPLPRGGDVFGASDNEWLYFLRAYGSVGVFWLVLFLFVPFLYSIKNNYLITQNFNYYSFAMVVMTCIYMVPAGVITSSSLSSLFIALLAFSDKTIFTINNQ